MNTCADSVKSLEEFENRYKRVLERYEFMRIDECDLRHQCHHYYSQRLNCIEKLQVEIGLKLVRKLARSTEQKIAAYFMLDVFKLMQE